MKSATLKPKVQVVEEMMAARATGKALTAFLKEKRPVTLVAESSSENFQALTVPASALHVLVQILEAVGRGEAVEVIPVAAELTTQQAADILNVSRPYLVSLLETGKIPFRKVGTHRRVQKTDIVAYKKKSDTESEKALTELAQMAQEYGLGYD